VREPYKWPDWDPNGDDAAEEIRAATPAQVRWALLKQFSDPDEPTEDLKELDRQVRPWAHEATP
jgi:hypothetical protein